MDVSLATAFIGTKTASLQLAIAAKMLRMNAEAARSAMQIVEAAQTNMDKLANVAVGVGENLDISV
jgi:hypothetical protein